MNRSIRDTIIRLFGARGSIARRLAITLLSFGVIAAIISMMVRTYNDHQNELKEGSSLIVQINVSHGPSLSESIWNYSEERLETELRGILDIPRIEFAEVISIKGDVWSAGTKSSSGVLAVKLPLTVERNGKDENLGTLNFQITQRGFYDHAKINGIGALVTFGGWAFFSVILLIIVFNQLVTRHLLALAEYADELSLDAGYPHFVLDRPKPKSGVTDEFDSVVNAINSSQSRLAMSTLELQENEQNLRVTLNSIGDAVIATDTSGNITRMNPIAESLCGWKQNEAVGKHMDKVFNIISADTREPAFNPVDTVLAEGKTVDLANHTILVSRDGAEYQIADSAAPIKSDSGDILGVVLVFRDVTEEYRVREDLNDALVNAERANQAKSEFLATMSHELRTPLNAVLGFGQMMQFSPNDPLSPNQNEYVENILEGGNHLLKLVNQILDLESIEADQIDLSLIDLEANDVVSNCVNLVAPLGEERKIKIIDNFSDGPSALLFTDRTRLKQVLINLLGNAIKFNDDGGTVTIEGTETDYGYLRISVTDTGIGIAKKDQSSVFNLFQRASADPMVAVEGTGIGLTVTKLLVERMAGRIGVESEVGTGSTFWIDIPLASNDDVLIWTDAIKIDVDAIDRDHQVLVSMFNRIMGRSADEADVDDIIDDLIEYTQYHFSREEAVMKVCGYPAFESHRDLHRRLIDDLNEHSEAWRNDRTEESLNLFRNFLKDWLFDHILKEDSKIANSARGKDRDIRQKLEALGLLIQPSKYGNDN